MMESASFWLIARRALQTWHMKLDWRANNLICCSSPNPNSRRREVISGEAESFLMQTVVPACTRLNGQTLTPAQRPSKIT